MSGIAALARRPGLVMAAVLLVTGLALLPASRIRLRSDLSTLLPEGAPAAEDYRVFLERFGGLEKVFVLVLPDPAGSDESDLVHAAGLLEERLAASPEVASVRAGIDPGDEQFFSRYVASRAPLLMTGDWLAEVSRRIEPQAIRERVARLRSALSSPAGRAETVFAGSDPLGFSGLGLSGLTAAAAPADLPLHLLSSTFLATRGDAALLILTPSRSETDPEGGRALLAELEAAYAEVRQSLDAELRFLAVGGPIYAAQDELLLRRDLERTVAGSLLATGGILLLAFESFLMPLAALSPLLVALLWTAAFQGLVRPEVSAMAIGFAAVLVGLGIDYGIHTGARFRQSFLATPDAARALAATADHCGPGILTSAVTTAAGFAVLGLAHFRPLAELGQLVAVGILAILVAVVLMGSAGLVLVAPRLRPPGRAWRLLGSLVDRCTGFAVGRAKSVLAVAAGLSILALWGLGGLTMNPDLRALRPVDHPAHEAEELLAERFGLGLETATVVVHGRDLGQTLERVEVAARLVREAAGEKVEISSPADYLTAGEAVAERLRQLANLPLARAADQLESELRSANLNPRAFRRGLAALRAMGRGEDPGAPPPEAWPDWLAQSLRVTPEGAWAALRLRLPVGSWPDGPPAELVAKIKQAVPDSAFASVVAIGGELRELALRDLRGLGLLALVAVVVVVVVSFRGGMRYSVLASLPVLLGSLWTLGLWAALGRPLDLFSLAVLPIMLGIGIDDGLHVIHGARRAEAGGTVGTAPAAVPAETGRGPIVDSVRSAGRALVLTTLTTCAGFGSLLLSGIPALRSGGMLIAAGVLGCWLATVLVLPALEAAGRTGWTGWATRRKTA